jgi:hypothetical protein
MKRGRIVFWSISGLVIAGGIGFYLWLNFVYLKPPKDGPRPEIAQMNRDRIARDNRAPRAWAPADAWWKATTIEAFDRVTAGKTWPSARRAVVEFGCDLSGDPPRTGDEADDALEAARLAVGEYECDDPLVRFIHARYLLTRSENQTDHRDGAASMLKAVDGFRTNTAYPVYIRCLAILEAAEVVTRYATGVTRAPKSKAIEFANEGIALLPAVGAEKGMPTFAIQQLIEQAGHASKIVRRDRMEVIEQLLGAMEKSDYPKSEILTGRGETLVSYAWDARGGGYANTVTEDGWRSFRERLGKARAALTEACDADPKNSHAAAVMITCCMGESADRDEMEKWFKRAMAANPGNYNACNRKMLFLEPKWGGSVEAMLGFGRELPAMAAEPRALRVPLNLVDAHWTLAGGRSGPNPAYFQTMEGAWDDVQKVYEKYLAQVPEARYHRTRYAVIAAWAGQWAIADAQFTKLGEGYSRKVTSENVIKALRAQAKTKAASRSI